MPKVVDHEARRRLIADALLRIAAKHGLESVSLRHVADEAGVSPGMVQHYFRTKDEMMLFALDVVRERVSERMDAAAGSSPSAAQLVRALLVQLLPFDRHRREEGRVMLAFLAYAAVKPAIAKRLREDNVALRALVAGLIGAADPDVDADTTAGAMLALMDGLGLRTLNRDHTPDEALAIFDAYAAKTFGTT